MKQSNINQIDITWQQLFGDIPGIRNYCQNRICIKREVIPIIFVPGLMGSRLKRKEKAVGDKDQNEAKSENQQNSGSQIQHKNGSKSNKQNNEDPRIWDPDDAKFMVKKFGKRSATAAKRKALVIGPEFNSNYAEVDNNNSKHNNEKFKSDSNSDRTRAERGWGGVMWDSYGEFIIKLQTHFWPKPHDYCFEFPVHAFGYNWTDSSENTGLALKEYIDRTIEEHRNGKYSPDLEKRECKYVILITHSMGGLVARSACMLHGAEKKVLGVIHGVQPATGAPAGYWRMKAGFERPRGGPSRTWWDWFRSPLKMARRHILGRIAAVILGTDGEEVTSLMGNMPGGLQLLPTKDYMDNQGNREWLSYATKNGEVKLPKADPYKEIYLLEDEAYRAVNPDWLDPGGEQSKLPGTNKPWQFYQDYLTKAKNFHDKLRTQFHPDTYQFYGTDLDSADKIVFTRKEREHRPHHPHNQYEPGFVNKGTFRTYVDKYERPLLEDTKAAVAVVTMGMPDGMGDGTVPESSGKALQIGVGPVKNPRTIRISKDEPDDFFKIDHQNIYSTTKAREIVFECVWHLVEKRIDEEIGVKKEAKQ
jgi:pimeloyl-ACP methyl ester carboxylesterase